MTPRGFISPTLLGVIGVAVIIGGLGLVVKVQSVRLEAANSRIEAYKQAGEIALAYAKRKDTENKAKKEKSDADYKLSLAALRRDNKRLRDSANSSSLPPTSPGSPISDRIAFDRPQLDAAIRGFTAGTAAIATEGAEAVNALNNAKEWARSIKP